MPSFFLFLLVFHSIQIQVSTSISSFKLVGMLERMYHASSCPRAAFSYHLGNVLHPLRLGMFFGKRFALWGSLYLLPANGLGFSFCCFCFICYIFLFHVFHLQCLLFSGPVYFPTPSHPSSLFSGSPRVSSLWSDLRFRKLQTEDVKNQHHG